MPNVITTPVPEADGGDAATLDGLDSTAFVRSTLGGREGYTDLGTVSGAVALDVADGNVQELTVGGATTISFTGFTTTGEGDSVSLIVNNGGTDVTWSGVTWPAGTAPTLTASGRDRLAFASEDGGTTIDGALVGADFS